MELAKANDCAWIETSAKNDINVSKCPFLLPSSQGVSLTAVTSLIGKVFELCLQEIERNMAPNQTEPQTKGCVVM